MIRGRRVAVRIGLNLGIVLLFASWPVAPFVRGVRSIIASSSSAFSSWPDYRRFK